MTRNENSKIITKIQEDFAYENGIGRFSVIVANNDTKVNWYQNETLIQSSNFSILKMEQTSFKNNRCLIVKNCTDSDFCKYTVKTDDGKEEYSTYLTKSLSRQEYLDKIDNKMFLSGMLDQEVPQGQTCQFSVILINRFAEVKWMKGGQAVSGGDFEERSNGNERTLIVKNCKDSAEYSIQCGNDKMSAKLNVKGSNNAPEPAAPAAPATTSPPAKTEEPAPKPSEKPPATVEETQDEPRLTERRETLIAVREIIEGGPWKKDDEGHWRSTTIIKRIQFKPLPDPLIRAETMGTKWAYDGARWAPIPVSS